jgi:hypothetical protein
MSVSSMSTGTLPTWAFHTAACTTRPGRSMGTVSTPPPGASTGSTGSRAKS